MNPHVIYNGVSSEALGLIVEELPTWHRAQRRVSEQTIPGRPGALVQDDGGYDLYSATLRVNCNGADPRDVYAWLRGEGWMISSDEPDYKAYVYAYGGVDANRLRVEGACYDSLSVSLRVEPYLRLVTEQAVTLNAAGTFEGQGHDASAPLIAVTGAGDPILMVNDATLYLYDLSGTLYIDAEAGIAYTLEEGAPVFAGTQVSLEEGEWPALLPAGEVNLVNWTGAISSVVIQPNWRWL